MSTNSKKSSKVANKFVGLIVLDGFGLTDKVEGNAIKLANPTNFNSYMANYPNTTLSASGRSVGLPEGQMGGSEVGHINIGAGKVVFQSFEEINNAINDKSFFSNDKINAVFEHVVANDSTLHIMGLLSDSGIHSHINHLFALIDSAREHGVKNAVIHCFTDGRDTYIDVSCDYLAKLRKKIEGTNYKIGVVVGRAYAMDRESNWDRTKLVYDAICYGAGNDVECVEDAIKQSYSTGVYDEFLLPIINHGYEPLGDNDGVIHFNFREDRGRQLTSALIEPNFDKFVRKNLSNVVMCTLTDYDKTFVKPLVAYPKRTVDVNLSSIISNAGLKQFKVSETTKYAHVTYFLNGGIEKPYPNEDRYLIETIKTLSFDKTPAMRAVEITDKAIERIKTRKYSFMCANYSNTDMIGHTGNLKAAIETVKIVDRELKRLVDVILSIGGVAVIVADHGNAEEMVDDEGRILTDHTTNPVPCIIISKPVMDIELAKKGCLGNIAPTVLELLNLPKPQEFELPSLIK